jgi:hypothetical protein
VKIQALAMLGALAMASVAFSQEAATTAPNRGRDPSLPPEKNSPVVHPMRAARSLEKLKDARLYSFSERDVDAYLKFLSADEADPIKRVIHLARKNIGQAYDIYLLGEGPYELYDPDPLYCLEKSDCVTFVENTYAMALSRDWPSFFRTLQRIRYKDGKIGTLTRNHESTADWIPNNAWLFEEITEKLAEGKATAPMHQTWRPAAFFAQWGIGQDLPSVTIDTVYIPWANISSIVPELQDGDLCLIVKGNAKEQYVGHFGMSARGPDGEYNMIHSAEPAVREQGILDYFERNNASKAVKQKPIGMKVLRPRPQMQQLVDAKTKE